jgi:ketosteroid isomerase-like protein
MYRFLRVPSSRSGYRIGLRANRVGGNHGIENTPSNHLSPARHTVSRDVPAKFNRRRCLYVQKHFAEAYNHKDVDAMAAAFTENGIRVTPSGIFQGRDAIRRNLQDALNMGLHDFTARRTISRLEGNFVFNAGEWQATLGDRPFHGYYTAILVREGNQAKIMEETVTVAAP